jgi:hypothetical protein
MWVHDLNMLTEDFRSLSKKKKSDENLINIEFKAMSDSKAPLTLIRIQISIQIVLYGHYLNVDSDVDHNPHLQVDSIWSRGNLFTHKLDLYLLVK